MKLGLDRFLEGECRKWAGKRVGLLTNITGVNERLVPGIDLFHEHPEINLTALFSPEHGIRGDAREGEKVGDTVDPYTGVKVYSLYGEDRKPTPDMLDEVDVVVMDLQDIGSRYYTYIYTMAYMMEACGANGKQFCVLDRPNPISGEQLEGNLIQGTIRSFVGMYPIPNRHGMTIGEIARLFAAEFGVGCDLTVVEMEGWHRSMYHDQAFDFWVPPSPNISNLDTAILYPGTCLIEGTNLSEGRGTSKPFEVVGAPFIDGKKLAKAVNSLELPGVIARETSFTPSHQKFKGERCGGIQLHIADRKKLNSYRLGVRLLEITASLYPDEFKFIESNGRYFFDLLAGDRTLRQHIWEGTADLFLEEAEKQLVTFREIREGCLLYG